MTKQIQQLKHKSTNTTNKASRLGLLAIACFSVIVCCSFVVCEAEDKKLSPDDFTREDGIVVLNGANFAQALETFDNLLVEFYATWCGHCKAFAPDYIKIAEKLGTNVTCAKVDTPDEHDLIEKYDIQGFPTIKLFRGTRQPENYSGFRSVDQLVHWALRKIGPPAETIETAEQAEQLKSDNEVLIVAYIKDSASNEATTFSEVADSIDDHKFGIVSSQDVATKLGFEKEGIKLFKKFDEGEATYDGDLTEQTDIKKFIQSSSMPLVVEFDQKIAQKIFGGDLKAHNLLFVRKSDEKTEAIIAEFTESAKQFKSKVLFVMIDADKDEHERIIEYFGLKKEELPGLRFIKLDEEMTKYKYPHEEHVADKITEFAKGVLEGKIKPHLLSQELPEDWDKHPVKVLVGNNFDEVAFNTSVNVLVEFYAPWCGHCKALAPIYEQLGEKYKDDPNVVIAKMDAASNELEHTRINSYPTIKLYKKETNEAIEYGAERTLDGLSKFIDTDGEFGRAASEEVSEELDEPMPEDGKPLDKHDEL